MSMYYPAAIVKKPDSALSATSENSVQNKVVKAALDLKLDASDKPTKTSDLTNDSGFIDKTVNDLTNYYTSSNTYTKTEVDAKISSTYKAGGSVAFANLPANDASHEGFVYDVTDSFTTTSDFVEGAGIVYPANTNVAIVDVGTSGSPSYKYDALAGFVDLSGYQSKNLTTTTEGASTVEGALTALATNKLEISSIDNALSNSSENPVQNKVIKGALDLKFNTADIDSALSSSSENPVQNKVINTALAGKVNTSDIDSSMSASSENPVQNKVIKAYVDSATGGVVDTVVSGTLTAGQTSLALTNAGFTSTAVIDIFTDIQGVNPTDASLASTTLTLTFDEQATDLHVKVYIKAVTS